MIRRHFIRRAAALLGVGATKPWRLEADEPAELASGWKSYVTLDGSTFTDVSGDCVVRWRMLTPTGEWTEWSPEQSFTAARTAGQ